MWRSPIEEGEYEVETIVLLADHDDLKVKMKALDRADVMIGWLNGFSRRQLRVYKEPVEKMLWTLKDILKDIDDATRGSNEDRN